MIAMNLAQVADAIGLPVESGWADVCVLSVEFDTRRITPGALFVALHGEHADGHAFAGAAARAGAVAVLGSAPIDADLPLLRVAADPADSAVLAALGALARASVTAGRLSGPRSPLPAAVTPSSSPGRATSRVRTSVASSIRSPIGWS